MKKSNISEKSQTDWERVDALEDKDIDLRDAPEVSTDMFARGIVRRGLKPASRRTRLTSRGDSDAIEQKSFDEILKPFRDSVEASGISDDELDDLFREARREASEARCNK